jgi:hypothetical protein
MERVKGVVWKLDFCYDPQQGHMTLGRNGPGHAMSVQVKDLL